MKKPKRKTSFAAGPCDTEVESEKAAAQRTAIETEAAPVLVSPVDRAKSRRAPVAPLNLFESTVTYTKRASSSMTTMAERLMLYDHSDALMGSTSLPWSAARAFSRRRAARWRTAHLASEALLAVLYHVYLAWCVADGWGRTEGWCGGSRLLLALTLLAYAALAVVAAAAGLDALARRRPGLERMLAWRNKIWGAVLAVLFAAVLWDINGELKRMTSLAGIAVLLLLGYTFSKDRGRHLPPHALVAQISWSLVVGCVAATFLSGLVLLRLNLGEPVATCAVSKLRSYMRWLTAGGRFAFGYLAEGVNMSHHMANLTALHRDVDNIPPVFAFSVLPSLCYVALLARMLYYVGFVQTLLGGIDYFVTAGRSFSSYEVLIALVSVVNSPMESMLLVHPYLLTMSSSSLHCILTLECSTISGRLIPVYVDLGINSTYLLSASILSVPAALAYSKLVYPEAGPERQLTLLYRSPERTFIEAALTGATVGVYLMIALAANVVTYASVARFLDVFVAWAAKNVGSEQLSLQWLLEMAYTPVVLLMGVPWRDSRAVAQLLAIKAFLNEYVAFTAFVQTAHMLEARRHARLFRVPSFLFSKSV
ncbi:sodium/nucleoside cotransporter 1-like [Amblyomma americanum]